MTLPPIVALEIGTSKVRALVAEAREDGHIMITGLGESPSRGVRKGEVVDFDNAIATVKTTLDAAEEQGGVVVNQVHLAVTGSHIRSLVNRGNVPVLSPEGEINRDDIEQALSIRRVWRERNWPLIC